MRELSLNVMDVAQNSVRAEASLVTITVTESDKDDNLTISIEDNGCGMTEEQVQQVIDPFFTTRTTRKVGLGLPLLKQNTEQTGGSMKIESELGVGTTVTAVFGLTHLDRPPMGDLAGTMVLTIAAHPEIHFVFHFQRVKDGKEEVEYVLDTDEVYEALDGVSLQEPEVMAYLKEMVEENIK